MKIKFEGNIAELLEGIRIICSELCFDLGNDGIPVKVEKIASGIEVGMEEGQGFVRYEKKTGFFRGLGLFLQELHKGDAFHVYEKLQFDTCGPMFDLSRNAMMTMDSFKNMTRKLALMGLNTMMLYMEDTYEVKGEPYFGYMRGRYTFDELKAVDDYAFNFGIEVIPCIQTLAHVEEFLKWEAASELKDTRGVFLVESAKTYEFLDKMIASISAPFRSKRIHIGMDEAEDLGRGKYLDLHGYKKRDEIMTGHLEKVLGIVRKYGLKPMMWSDMFLKLAPNVGEDYLDKNVQIPQELIDKTPKDVQLMHWDYFHFEEDDYTSLIRQHKAFGKTPAFAGGIWVWNRIGVNYNMSLAITNAAMRACKKEGIQDVFVTLWGDDGSESNCFAALLGLQLYAEHMYAEEIDPEKLKERVKFCTGIDYEAFMDLNDLDETPGCLPGNKDAANPSKFLLWQDILLGLFDKHIEGLPLDAHYAKLEERIQSRRNAENELDFIFEVPEKLCSVLAIKSELGLKIAAAYKKQDKDALREIAAQQLPTLYQRVDALRKAHRSQWFKLFKPFGWEVIDIRYGGVLARIETVIQRLTDYVEGTVLKIEELEEERLFFDRHNRFNEKEEHGPGWCGYYYRIATANVFFHVLPI